MEEENKKEIKEEVDQIISERKTNILRFGTNKKKVFFLVGLIFLCLIFVFFLIYQKRSASNINNKGEEKQQGKNDAEEILSDIKKEIEKNKAYSFADFKLENTQYNPLLPEYRIGINDIGNLKDFEGKNEKEFSSRQKDVLEKDNFFISLNEDKFYDENPDSSTTRVDDWVQLYDRIGGSWDPAYRKPENSVFITSDFLLHVYHRLVEKEFEHIEQKEFYPRLQEMTELLLQSANKKYQALDGTNLEKEEVQKDKASLERLMSFFAVPAAILNSTYEYYKDGKMVNGDVDSTENIMKELELLKGKLPENSYNKAKQELELVMKAERMTFTPLFGNYLIVVGQQNSDYTQYQPRSHYNKNPILRSYFRAMMWYGRNNFVVASPELTRDALITKFLIEDAGQIDNWEAIYKPTAFFVGTSDDLGIYEYDQAMDDVGIKSFENINNDSVAKIQEATKKLEGPKVMSSVVFGDDVFDSTKEELLDSTKGFRFMGQRFTPDAFIFSTLTQGDELPDPETGEYLPSMTTATMVMSVLGNKTADPVVNGWISKNAPDSNNVIDNKISKLKGSFKEINEKDWTQNIYWGWLYTIKSLFDNSENQKNGYPMFVKNDNWDKKNLQSSLGSWTELKHDTLLYAKQSYAEMGGGGGDEEPLPVPKGYVEPNIEFFDRILALVKMTKEGLENQKLLDNEFLGRNDKFIKSLEFFRRIAVAQLQDEVISDEDFDKLRLEPGNLEAVLRPLPSEEGTEDGARSALIADVHTDVPGGQILYEANGIPNYIYVAVKDKNGTRLTKGLVFSYYEFTNPIENRLTDEKWREWVYAENKENVPEMPDWNKNLIK